MHKINDDNITGEGVYVQVSVWDTRVNVNKKTGDIRMDTEVSNYTLYTFKKCVLLGKDNFCSHSTSLMYMWDLSLIHISEPTRRYAISYAVFCLKKKTDDIRMDTEVSNYTHYTFKKCVVIRERQF